MAPEDEALAAARIERGRVLFAQDCVFVAGAAQDSQIPALELEEVAFAGRSNVGKSSLINALTGRKTLARTSNTPGRTRQLNFFELGGRILLVDLPGYGYARASKRDVAQWTAVTERYLKGRARLRRVFLLVDSRHGLKDSDRGVMGELDRAAVIYQVVLTKADKMKPGSLARARRALEEELSKRPAAHPVTIVTSAHEGQGIDSLRAEIAELAAPPAGG